MSTSINPDTFEEIIPAQPRDPYGPSDSVDSASDVVGTPLEGIETDAEGTGERPSVDDDDLVPSNVGHDLEPDVILVPGAPKEPDEEES
ncbi:hypothetical protein ACDA63_00060 [Uliginosibacterium sp. sgz301328]|uniref:hypothetical protein n=1 Tax=Uliginosibacterium sp. sgz301328 TaxID=3243764 RepID=UPI00359ED12C